MKILDHILSRLKKKKDKPVRANRFATSNQRRGSFSLSGRQREKEQPQTRRRNFLVLARVAVVAVVTSATLALAYLFYMQAMTSPHFSVDEFAVTGTARLSREEIIATAALQAGTNIFALDTAAATLRLRAHPWIRDALVERHLPRRIVVTIEERKAAALAIFDAPYLVDDAGVVFKRWAKGDPIATPVISGFTREQFAADRGAVEKGLRDALDLASRFRASGLERSAPLGEVHAEIDGGLSLALGREPFYAKLGKGPYRGKLQRLATLLEKMKFDGNRPAMIYLDNDARPDRVTVKLKRFSTDYAGKKQDLEEKMLSKI